MGRVRWRCGGEEMEVSVACVCVCVCVRETSFR